jgi:hypothetical protein
MNKNFLTGLLIGISIGISVFVVTRYIKEQDGYHLVKLVPSSTNKKVGVIVANMGGGGPGYCRDLIYIFPNIERLPDFSKEKDNRKYLIKELGCGEAKELRWQGEHLITN